MTRFVNPYTFVPHVLVPERGKPPGHARMRNGYLSGVLKVTLTVRTPLVIGGFTDKDTGEQVVPRRVSDGKAIVPGSGLLGAVRSVHEALVGGCLRVLDPDFVPVHRHPANTQETKDLRLAVVTEVDAEGKAVKVAVCESWMMIPAELLIDGEDGWFRTGDQLEYCPDGERAAPLPRGAVTETNGRAVLHARNETHEAGVLPGSIVRTGGMGRVTRDCWVLLVTDTNARAKNRPVRFVAGRTGPGARPYTVPSDTWKRYEETVAGADDLRPASLMAAGIEDGKEPSFGSRDPEYEAVNSPDDGKPLAERLCARTYLYEGQPVWVRLDEAEREVTEIRLSRLWRYQGEDSVGERVGAAMPCTEPDSLCWSCRVFGSADTEGRGKDDLAVQKGYRGHVRVDDLAAEGEFTTPTWHLAPLSSPRPGAGQFYLDNSRLTARKRLSAKDTKPAATWGSEADRPDKRPIRGRKFYWRTDGDPMAGTPPRGQRRKDQSEKLSKQVKLIPAGTVFTGRVRFDNLSVTDYGSLLAALDLRLLAEADDSAWGDTVTSVGGGKPFGFGAVNIDVEPEGVQTARMRYLGEQEQVPDRAEAVRAFAEVVPRSARAEWTRLRHALTFGYVNEDLVWYPPGPGEKGSKEFDESFEFFALTNGVAMTTGDHKLIDLPDPADGPEAQELEVPVRGSNAPVRERQNQQRQSRDRRQRRGGRG